MILCGVVSMGERGHSVTGNPAAYRAFTLGMIDELIVSASDEVCNIDAWRVIEV